MRYHKIIQLKTEEVCLLRNAEGDDAKALNECFCLTHSQTDFLTTYPDENEFDFEADYKELCVKVESDNEVEICAVLDERIVGSAGIEAVGKKDKVKHRAELGISIEDAYKGKGIGRALTLACIECAKEAGYMQIELVVVSENIPAIKLYESVGFVEYGRNPKGFRNRQGKWQELVLMRKEL